jgi:hypothetical protein
MFLYALIKSGFAQEYKVAGYKSTRDHEDPTRGRDRLTKLPDLL